MYHLRGVIIPVFWAIYFTYMLDYMLMPALTQFFARAFSANPKEIGSLVSVYNFSASFFGLLGAFFLDRYSRKATLLTLYFGFGVSLIVTSFATTLDVLIVCRAVTGLFGGLMIATLFSTIGDAIAPEKQGMAFGTVLSSFSLASILGIPLGLWVCETTSWQHVFLMSGGLSLAIFVFGFGVLPTIALHQRSGSATFFDSARTLLSRPITYFAICVAVFIGMASYAVIPFINPFLSIERGLSDAEIRYLYIFGGLATFLISFPIGYLSDLYPKTHLFGFLTVILIPFTVLFSTMPSSTYWLIAVIFIGFMMLSRARRIPALAILTNSITPALRASFMSVVTSCEQFFSGFAASLSGVMLTMDGRQDLSNFLWVGILSAVFALTAYGFLIRVQGSGYQSIHQNAISS